MASSGRDSMSVSSRHVRNNAAAAAAGKPHAATFGNAAPKGKAAPKNNAVPTGEKFGYSPGAQRGGSK